MKAGLLGRLRRAGRQAGKEAVDSPRVSVVMSVYNCSSDVGRAIRSILDQTYRNFEFIIVDDASTDNSMEIVARFDDPRIRVLSNRENLGLASSLNRGIRAARGEFVARMDCDDVSLPARLKHQVRYMDRNPEVTVCGSFVRAFGHGSGVWHVPTEHEEIRAQLLFNNSISHPSVMMRKSHLDTLPYVYEEGRRRVEDYELWVRISPAFRLVNIDRPLLLYRTYDVRRLRKHPEVIAAGNVIRRGLLQEMDMDVSDGDLELHMQISRSRRNDSVDFIVRAGDWFERLLAAHERRPIYDPEAFLRTLGVRWWRVCKGSTELGPISRRLYLEHPLSRLHTARPIPRLGFVLRSWLRTRNDRFHPVLSDGLDYYRSLAAVGAGQRGPGVNLHNKLESSQ